MRLSFSACDIVINPESDGGLSHRKAGLAIYPSVVDKSRIGEKLRRYITQFEAVVESA